MPPLRAGFPGRPPAPRLRLHVGQVEAARRRDSRGPWRCPGSRAPGRRRSRATGGRPAWCLVAEPRRLGLLGDFHRQDRPVLPGPRAFRRLLAPGVLDGRQRPVDQARVDRLRPAADDVGARQVGHRVDQVPLGPRHRLLVGGLGCLALVGEEARGAPSTTASRNAARSRPRRSGASARPAGRGPERGSSQATTRSPSRKACTSSASAAAVG